MATKNFHKWETDEILEWLWDYETVPALQTPCNYYTYILAIQELRNRQITKEEFYDILHILKMGDT